MLAWVAARPRRGWEKRSAEQWREEALAEAASNLKLNTAREQALSTRLSTFTLGRSQAHPSS